MTDTLRPPFPYYGAKSRLAPWIASLLPAHEMYVEPFCGSAAVLFAKAPARSEVINDLDRNVVAFFRTLREQRDDLVTALRLTPYARDEYFADRLDVDDISDLERARRFFVRSTQAFNGMGNSDSRSGSWSAGVRVGSTPDAVSVRDLVERLHQHADRLRAVSVDARPAAKVIAAFDGPAVAMYVDPPYLGETRTSLDDAKRRSADYRHDMSAPEEHVALAETLHACKAAVLLSGYPSPLYDDLYSDWYRAEMSVQRPATNRRGRAGTGAVEVIWSNRPIGRQPSLFDDLAGPEVAL
ncbi:DNA adenine methylase [Catenuloplanes indicus]|uniref:DNA adenine methylase n=1 Tax=Catenuloplanes indicus TaxID=137267 RepID=A0AAE3W7Q2_9ACTN|nr:DNA adenine methylase [Catenuloplanes indicus]MDQ0371548.1 DNA adenine methylase [Catenuloplanes indicus]